MIVNSEESFFDVQPMFICEQSTLKIKDVNKPATNLLGYSKKYMVGKTILDLGSYVDPSGLDLDRNMMKKLEFNDIWLFKCEDGSNKYFQISSHMIKYKGNPSKLVVAHNISDLVNKNEIHGQLLSSEINFNNFPLAEIEFGADYKIKRWSKNAEKLFGYNSREALSDDGFFNKVVHPDDNEYVVQNFERIISEGKKEFTLVNRNITKSGKVIYCEWYNAVLYNANDELLSVYCLTHDVTDREKALLETRRSMRSYQDLFHSISDAIYLLNNKGHIVELNEGFIKTFGYKREEVIGKHNRVLAPLDKYNESRLENIIENSVKGETYEFEGWGKKKNGEEFPTEFLVNSSDYFGEDVLIVIERDISERKASEEALKHREELLSKLFNSSPIGIVLLNADHEVEMTNDGFEQMFGYSEEELIGLKLDDFIVPKNKQDEATRLSESEKVKQVVQKRTRKDGFVIDVILYVVPVIVGSKIVGIYGLYVDITDRIEAENRLHESLREKEMLLAEIHHRVKNNLAVISGLLELQTYSVDSETAKEVLRESQMRVNSIAMVHEKLYKSEDFSEVNIGHYFKELSDIVYETLKQKDMKVEINLDIEEVNVPIIQGIPCGLILNEILTNSMKHAFKGKKEGRVNIKLRKEDDLISIKMCDDGVGLPENTDLDINDSMGMTLIQTLAKQLNATYGYSSEEGEGTCFGFTFEREEGEKLEGKDFSN